MQNVFSCRKEEDEGINDSEEEEHYERCLDTLFKIDADNLMEIEFSIAHNTIRSGKTGEIWINDY